MTRGFNKIMKSFLPIHSGILALVAMEELQTAKMLFFLLRNGTVNKLHVSRWASKQ